jgi:hypothetical protein
VVVVVVVVVGPVIVIVVVVGKEIVVVVVTMGGTLSVLELIDSYGGKDPGPHSASCTLGSVIIQPKHSTK